MYPAATATEVGVSAREAKLVASGDNDHTASQGNDICRDADTVSDAAALMLDSLEGGVKMVIVPTEVGLCVGAKVRGAGEGSA